MKIIKIESCGMCPHNTMVKNPEGRSPHDWIDYCELDNIIIKNHNIISEECLLEDSSWDFQRKYPLGKCLKCGTVVKADKDGIPCCECD